MPVTPRILYREGFKYQNRQDYSIQLPKDFQVDYGIETPFLLITAGTPVLTIKFGYAWDGPSGPTRDTKSSMRASMVHDALYQLMRMRVLSLKLRQATDDLFYRILKEDGMNRVRRFFWWRGVRRFAKSAAASEARPVLAAP